MDIFINFLYGHQSCAIESLKYVADGLIVEHEDKAINLLPGLANLQFPLNCSQFGIFEYSSKIIYSYKDVLNKISQMSEMESLPPTCERLIQAAVGLESTVSTMLSRIENQTLRKYTFGFFTRNFRQKTFSN